MSGGRRARWLLTAATLLVMAMIFLFSCQSGEASDRMSGVLSTPLLRFVLPEAETLPPEAREAAYAVMQFMIRKLAHFCEYALLGCLLRLTAECWFPGRRTGPAAFLTGALYAGTDELHQLLTAQRSGMWQDVALDSAGVLAGLAVALAILYLLEKNRK